MSLRDLREEKDSNNDISPAGKEIVWRYKIPEKFVTDLHSI